MFSWFYLNICYCICSSNFFWEISEFINTIIVLNIHCTIFTCCQINDNFFLSILLTCKRSLPFISDLYITVFTWKVQYISKRSKPAYIYSLQFYEFRLNMYMYFHKNQFFVYIFLFPVFIHWIICIRIDNNAKPSSMFLELETITVSRICNITDNDFINTIRYQKSHLLNVFTCVIHTSIDETAVTVACTWTFFHIIQSFQRTFYATPITNKI